LNVRTGQLQEAVRQTVEGAKASDELREPQDRHGSRPCDTLIDSAARHRGDRMMSRRDFITLLAKFRVELPTALVNVAPGGTKSEICP
jgi:hypothetical protein